MEMSLNRTSLWPRPSVLLPWLLAIPWALSLPDPVAPATPANGTLLFESGASLRSCICPARLPDCHEALANLQCSCRSVPRSALPPGGLRAAAVTVWVRQPGVLQLLNGSEVSDLRLASCGPAPLPSQHLAVFGLRRLRVHSGGSAQPDRVLHLAGSSSSSVLRLAVLDVSVLNGLSALKAFSVAGPTLPTLARHFPQLTLPPPPPPTPQDPQDTLPPPPPPTPQDPQDTLPSDPQQDCLLTFIY